MIMKRAMILCLVISACVFVSNVAFCLDSNSKIQYRNYEWGSNKVEVKKMIKENGHDIRKNIKIGNKNRLKYLDTYQDGIIVMDVEFHFTIKTNNLYKVSLIIDSVVEKDVLSSLEKNLGKLELVDNKKRNVKEYSRNMNNKNLSVLIDKNENKTKIYYSSDKYSQMSIKENKKYDTKEEITKEENKIQNYEYNDSAQQPNKHQIFLGSKGLSIRYDTTTSSGDDLSGFQIGYSRIFQKYFELRASYYNLQHDTFSNVSVYGLDLGVVAGKVDLGFKIYGGVGFFSETWENSNTYDFSGLEFIGGLGYNWRQVGLDLTVAIRDSSDYENFVNSVYGTNISATVATASLNVGFRF